MTHTSVQQLAAACRRSSRLITMDEGSCTWHDRGWYGDQARRRLSSSKQQSATVSENSVDSFHRILSLRRSTPIDSDPDTIHSSTAKPSLFCAARLDESSSKYVPDHDAHDHAMMRPRPTTVRPRGRPLWKISELGGSPAAETVSQTHFRGTYEQYASPPERSTAYHGQHHQTSVVDLSRTRLHSFCAGQTGPGPSFGPNETAGLPAVNGRAIREQS
jgi:hypothetical protein